MLKIDTHFHPNFMFRLPRQFGVIPEAKNIWEALEKHDLDAILVTEHVFKHPATSYKFLLDSKPEGAKTMLIPGVEASTKEGIDVIVFSRDTYVYTCKDIMTTKGLTFDEMVDVINKDDRLYGVVTHPFSLSQTAITKHFPVEKVLEASKQLGIIEKHNTSFVSMKALFARLGLVKIPFVQEIMDTMSKVDNVPTDHYASDTIVFGGSDAHSPDDLGDYLLLDTDTTDIFQALIDPTVTRSFYIDPVKTNVWWYMFRNFFIILRERLINVFRLYAVDGQYFPDKKRKKNRWKNSKLLFLRIKSFFSGIEFS